MRCTTLHPLIHPGFCWRHLETHWSLCKTYATSNDTSWIPLETPGDLLETSRDIPLGLLHPMMPPGFCWRHLETCWRHPETYHEVHYATPTDTSWILLETPGDSLEPLQDICQHSLHPMIPPVFCCRHLDTCWRHPETYHKVYYIQ